MDNNADWLAEATSALGAACAAKLAGPGDREAAIRGPVEAFLKTVGEHLGLRVTAFDEARDAERGVRPDFAIQVNGAICGYVELKAPGTPLDPERLRGHNARQWQRQKDLPNLLYTNGTEWRLYRAGEPVPPSPVQLRIDPTGDLATAAATLAPAAGFEHLITNFLQWKPAAITSVATLVRAITPLTRLLRDEVKGQLTKERQQTDAGASLHSLPFLGLSDDWRQLLFPDADDAEFADGYAQAVTFALLLARTQGANLADESLQEIGKRLAADHSLMGRALGLLTGETSASLQATLDLMRRVIGAVDWPRVQRGRSDTYLHLYEHFLNRYDDDLRKATGTYYTPVEVVGPMVRLAEDALRTRLGIARGYRDDSVVVLDPAMGTGTYLLSVIDRVAREVSDDDGAGAAAEALAELSKRLIGFELQLGPYAVAELRMADAFAEHGAPAAQPQLFVTNTLDDPAAEEKWIPHSFQAIALQRQEANKIKANAKVTVCLGNPPYGDRAEGQGNWVESGGEASETNPRPPILDDFRDPDTARHFHNLKNLYVYFWRWATWKVWESTTGLPEGDAGVVCFITTAGYLAGPGFTGMRRYLRQWASEGWVIDLTPEGQTPDVPTRIFPGVRQPLAIGLFVRQSDKSLNIPAKIHFRAVSGPRQAKFAALGDITLDDGGWADARQGWTAPLTAAAAEWDQLPAMDDLFPWASPGVKGNRRWPFAPSKGILERRWQALRSADPNSPEIAEYLRGISANSRPVVNDQATARSVMFKETRDRALGRTYQVAFATGSSNSTNSSLTDFAEEMQTPIQIGHRALTRTWAIPDNRVVDWPRPDLWAALQSGQVFTVELHSQPGKPGPGLAFTDLVPDQHYFKGSEGGRTLPLLHPDGTPNLAPGLLSAFPGQPTAPDLLAYVAAVVAHPEYTARFESELRTPGVRVPITADPALFAEAVELGHQILRLHTYGNWVVGADAPGPAPVVEAGAARQGLETTDQSSDIRYPKGDPRRIKYTKQITETPSTLSYDAERGAVVVGDGEFAPVPQAAYEYQVGGKNVIKQWFDYRKRVPGGKRTSPLDYIHTDTWPRDWSDELVELLSVLAQLVELEPAQADLLTRIMDSELLAKPALAESVTWPTSPRDPIRRPRPKPTTTNQIQTLFE